MVVDSLCLGSRLPDTYKRKKESLMSVQADRMVGQLHVCDRMSKSRYGEKRCTVEILDEGFMVDGGRHQNHFEFGMSFQQVLQLEKKEVSVN